MAKLPQEPVTAHINNITHEGRGIAQINGKKTFIQGALPLEEVKFLYTKKHSKYDEGETVEVLTASPERIEPACPHYAMCGGCSLQHWDPLKQIEHKQKTLQEHLTHFGGIQPEAWLAPMTGPVFHYRHKARLGVRYIQSKGDALVGFRERNGRYITDIQSCQVMHPSVGGKIIALRKLITAMDAVYHIPQIEVAIDDTKAALIFRNLELLSEKDIALLKQFGEQECFDIYLQPSNIPSIYKLYPEDHQERLKINLVEHRIELLFHPSDFTQINLDINRQMIRRAIELLDLNDKDKVLDLFCGIGNLSLPIARYCASVVGVEGSAEMVNRANENARHNHITNAEFYAADLTQPIDSFSWAKQHYTKILLDPPRTGALELVKEITRFKVQKIVYISCNPATLARDIAEFIQHGYQLKKVGIMDMFPNTTHVESIAVLEK
jgi:23S rRNA (uracil1939-C5)-methyltransferase